MNVMRVGGFVVAVFSAIPVFYPVFGCVETYGAN